MSFKKSTCCCFWAAILVLVLGVSAQAAPGPDFSELAKAASPAVVNISTERVVTQRERMTPHEFFRDMPGMPEEFRDFFEGFGMQPKFRDQGQQRQDPKRQGRSRNRRHSLGSGFIISADGYIVTNNHVIQGADVVRVNLGSDNDKEKSYIAEVLGTDPETDLALLKISETNLPTLEFGDSDSLQVGEWALAIGNPFGLDHTVTAGIISAKERNIRSGPFDSYLQTDASINPGNSGGPLLNMEGKVVGINTAIVPQGQGIGFAIPSSMAKKIIDSLRSHRRVSRGWLGVGIQDVDETMAKALGMKSPKGAFVDNVFEGQPADKAGIKPGDVILSVNGKDISDTAELLRTVAGLTPGDKSAVTVWRGSSSITLFLTLGERENMTADSGKQPGKAEENAPSSKMGIRIRPVTAEESARLRVEQGVALLVIEVEKDSPADQADIRPGDVIIGINRAPLANMDSFNREVEKNARENGAILLQLFRNGKTFFRAVDFSLK